MKLDSVHNALADQRYGVTEEQGRLLYEFIIKNRASHILELGTGHGTSACYAAAALEEIGGGKFTSIDRDAALPEIVQRTFAKADSALLRYVELITTPTSYNDELLPIIERQTRNGRTEPIYDLCFIDGAHTWSDDGMAFFLCDRLLKPGGWMLFDDMAWTIAGSPEASREAWTQQMPQALRETMQVTKIFDLLVATHPGYDNLIKVGDWGWAQKKGGSATTAFDAKSLYVPQTLKDETFALGKKIAGRLVQKITGRTIGSAERSRESRRA